MPASHARVNVTLPAQLLMELDEAVGPRKKSSFIAQAVQESLERLKRSRLEQALEEGYKARREESQAMARQFEHADLEGWGEDY